MAALFYINILIKYEKVVFEKHGYGFLIRLKYLYKKSLNIFHNFV